MWNTMIRGCYMTGIAKGLREGSNAQGRWVGDLLHEEDEFQWLFGCTE